MVAWTWRDTTVLSRFGAGDWFSVPRFFDANDRCGGWYVNFEQPFQRTTAGIDTFDLLLDLLVDPDLSDYTWKDEDAHGRRIRLISDNVHASEEDARGKCSRSSRTAPVHSETIFSHWRRDPGWPLPVLPSNPAEADEPIVTWLNGQRIRGRRVPAQATPAALTDCASV
jgi:hypothetical protein